MFERELAIYAFLMGYARKLVADVEEADLTAQPSPGMNHPAWQLGHLAVASDFALKVVGAPMTLQKRWFRDFGPGSQPNADRSAYPSKDALLAAYEAGHGRVMAAVGQADPVALAEPHDLDFPGFREALPTKAHLLTHLLTSHEGMHVGHLSSWRRLMGKPYLF